MADLVSPPKEVKNKFDKYYAREWRKKNPESVLKSARKFRKANKKRLRAYHKKWYRDNRAEHDARGKRYIKENPWVRHYSNARQRCTNLKPTDKDFNVYQGKGIKFKMSVDEFKFLWFRDRAFEMGKPSIDRKDRDGDYVLSNCEFVEMAVNLKRRFL